MGGRVGIALILWRGGGVVDSRDIVAGGGWVRIALILQPGV